MPLALVDILIVIPLIYVLASGWIDRLILYKLPPVRFEVVTICSVRKS